MSKKVPFTQVLKPLETASKPERLGPSCAYHVSGMVFFWDLEESFEFPDISVGKEKEEKKGEEKENEEE